MFSQSFPSLPMSGTARETDKGSHIAEFLSLLGLEQATDTSTLYRFWEGEENILKGNNRK